MDTGTAGRARARGAETGWRCTEKDLLAETRARGVAVEIDLTSNEVIVGVKDRAHRILIYRRFGVPYVISTDDPGVARNDLSSEYVLYAGRYRLAYDEVRATVFRSIRASFLTDAEKAAQLAALERRFAAFEAGIADLAATARRAGGS